MTTTPTEQQLQILSILDWNQLESTGLDDQGIWISHLETGLEFLLTPAGHLLVQ